VKKGSRRTSLHERRTKYRQSGYQDDQRKRAPKPTLRKNHLSRCARRSSTHLADGPKNSTCRASARSVRCSQAAIPCRRRRFETRCPKCGTRLHTCSQCVSFDPGSRFECMDTRLTRPHLAEEHPTPAPSSRRAPPSSAKRRRRAATTRERRSTTVQVLRECAALGIDRRPSATTSPPSITGHAAVLHPDDRRPESRHRAAGPRRRSSSLNTGSRRGVNSTSTGRAEDRIRVYLPSRRIATAECG